MLPLNIRDASDDGSAVKREGGNTSESDRLQARNVVRWCLSKQLDFGSKHLKTVTRVAYIFALSLTLGTFNSVAAPDELKATQSTSVRDGSHDFDFIYGKWRMPNRRLKQRLVGSHEWDEFITCDEGRPLPGGIGDIDYWKASYWKDFVGVTIRTYDPKTGLWRIY